MKEICGFGGRGKNLYPKWGLYLRVSGIESVTQSGIFTPID
jgi:hypothetical protein